MLHLFIALAIVHFLNTTNDNKTLFWRENPHILPYMQEIIKQHCYGPHYVHH